MPAIVVVAVAFVGGTFAGALLDVAVWQTCAVTALLVLAAGAASRSRVSLLVLGAAVAFAASGHLHFEAAATSHGRGAFTGSHEVIGLVSDDPDLRGITARVDLDIESVDGTPADGGLRLTLAAPREPLEVGDRLRLVADLEAPAAFDDFDYAAYLRDRGIETVAGYPKEWAVVGHDDGPPWAAAIGALRRWSIGNIERALPEPESSLAVGLLVGAQRTMPDDLVADLRATGTTHLVVVSGQNVALVVQAALALLTLALPRRRAALFALVAFVPGYVLLVGGSPPVIRAAFMAAGLIAAEVTGRRTPGWIFLAYAAAAMLALDPRLAVSVSFQLSLAATAGILLLAPPLRDLALSRLSLTNGGLAAAMIEVAAGSVGASLFVLPVQVAAFEAFPLLQIPANILIAPLYEVALFASVLAALAGALGPFAAALGGVLRLGPAAFIGLVRLMAGLPVSATHIEASLPTAIGWYAIVAALVWLLQHTRPRFALSPSTGSRWAPTFLLVVTAGGLWFAALAPPDRPASVTVLDVGQGLAVLVRDGGASVLIDVGPPDGAVVAALPRAGHQGGLDAAILSHDDSDHTGGLEPLRRRIEVGAVLAAATSSVPHAHDLDIGDRIRLSDRTTIEVLAPPVATGDELTSDNDRGLVLLVTVGERRFLLPADIEAAGEAWLVASGQDPHADVLVVPHHGSRTSSTPAFLAAVEPSIAIISAGAGNSYGHPHAEVVARYAGATLLRTDLDGDVTVRTDGERLWLETGRGELRDIEAQRAATPDARVTQTTSPR